MRVAGPGLNHSQLMEEFDVCMEPPFPAVGGNGGLQGHIARHLLGIYPQACRQLRDYEGLRGKGRKRLQGTTRDPKNMGRRTTRERVATLAANQPAEEPKSVLQYSSGAASSGGGRKRCATGSHREASTEDLPPSLLQEYGAKDYEGKGGNTSS